MRRCKEDSPFPGSNTLLLLTLLEEADKYGYQLIRELECRADTAFALQEGDIYPILHSLEARGEISSYEKDCEDGRRRRWYRLTRQGVRTVTRCRSEWLRLSRGFGKVAGGEVCVRK